MLRKASLHKVCNIAYALQCCVMGATRHDATMVFMSHAQNELMDGGLDSLTVIKKERRQGK